ncbi:hypothetical protein Taro_034031 [Colocasia esculenta]|uniref:Translin-associated protein X n=1 Tax=Colocasia esculenta TaxID=4460 RepID=A0A843WE97_COLES|nr:hypothetical protein [Colocasia esculenta]
MEKPTLCSQTRISKQNKEEVLEKAEKDLAAVTDQYMTKLVKELRGTDFWKLRRAYSPAVSSVTNPTFLKVQEYVEAATLCRFCKAGTLLNLDEINANLLSLSEPSTEPLQINILDYLLGVADLTGELMRLAIGRISDGELEYAEKICRFVRDIYREISVLLPAIDDNSEMKKKMETMLQSVVKIENALFSVHVRGSEYIPLLGSSDSNFSFLGVPDDFEHFEELSPAVGGMDMHPAAGGEVWVRIPPGRMPGGRGAEDVEVCALGDRVGWEGPRGLEPGDLLF